MSIDFKRLFCLSAVDYKHGMITQDSQSVKGSIIMPSTGVLVTLSQLDEFIQQLSETIIIAYCRDYSKLPINVSKFLAVIFLSIPMNDS